MRSFGKRIGTTRSLQLESPLRLWVQRIGILLLFSVAFSLMVLSKNKAPVVTKAQTFTYESIAPTLELLSQPVSFVENLSKDIRAYANLRQENLILRNETQRLEGWYHRAQKLEAENASLRKLLNVASEVRPSFITARAIGDQSGVFVESILINAGKQQGIEKGQAALNEQGLIGRVIEAGERVSRVLLISDINSKIPVVVGGMRNKAILAGDNSGQQKLLYLPPLLEVQVGEPVMTSGDGGALPAGLAVGVVTAVNDNGIFVTPYADLERLDFLRIVDYDLLDDIPQTDHLARK